MKNDSLYDLWMKIGTKFLSFLYKLMAFILLQGVIGLIGGVIVLIGCIILFFIADRVGKFFGFDDGNSFLNIVVNGPFLAIPLILAIGALIRYVTFKVKLNSLRQKIRQSDDPNDKKQLICKSKMVFGMRELKILIQDKEIVDDEFWVELFTKKISRYDSVSTSDFNVFADELQSTDSREKLERHLRAEKIKLK